MMGFANEQARLMAIQQTLEDLQFEDSYYHLAVGFLLCCPGCGANTNQLEPCQQDDPVRLLPLLRRSLLLDSIKQLLDGRR